MHTKCDIVAPKHLPVCRGLIILAAAVCSVLHHTVWAEETSAPRRVMFPNATEWRPEGIMLSAAVRMVAKESTDTIHVLEGWDDIYTDVIHEPGNPKSVTMIARESTQSLIPPPEKNAKSSDILAHIVRHKPGMEVREAVETGVRNIIRFPLVSHPSWPLNQPLGPDARRTLTFAQATELLYTKFALVRKETIIKTITMTPSYLLRATPEQQELVVWVPEYADRNSGAPTCRDLVNAMISKVRKPGSMVMIVPYNTTLYSKGQTNLSQVPKQTNWIMHDAYYPTAK